MRCRISIKKLRNNQGQTLIEILVAMGIAVTVITSMTIVVTSAISNANYSKNQNLATEFAQEGMEVVRQMQVNNYQTLSTLSGRYCLAPTCSAITAASGSCGSNVSGNTANCAVNISNTLIRQVDIFPPGSAQAKCVNTIQATVSVLWTDGKCQAGTYCHNQQIISCFSNTNSAQNP